MPAKRLKEFLEREGIRYSNQPHPTAYTAQEVAASAHIPGSRFAKTVIVNIDGKLAMVVLPANRKVIRQDLRELTGSDHVTFPSEDEFEARFPDCEPGAMPPFGNLYGMDVFIAPELAHGEEISFSAGTHAEVIRMAYGDFERLVHPQVASIAT
jgi:Ala-tRNA(Pro) deacylase